MEINFKLLKKIIVDRKIKFLLFGSINLIIAQIILAILLLSGPIFLATFFSSAIQIFLNYTTYSKYVFKSKKKLSKKNLLIYYLYAVSLWFLYSILIYFFNIIFDMNKNVIAIVLLPIIIPFTYLFQKNILFKSD